MKKILAPILALLFVLFSGKGLIFAKTGSNGHGEVIVKSSYAYRDNFEPIYPVGNDVQDEYIDDTYRGRMGFWLHGRRGDRLISEYKCYQGKSHASVLNGNGTYAEGAWVGPQEWSKASAYWSLTGTNKAYYDYR